MSHIQKIKQKIHDYRYEILATGFVAGLVTLAVVLDLKVAEQQREEAERIDNFIVEQNREGKTVYQLANGSYIAVRHEE